MKKYFIIAGFILFNSCTVNKSGISENTDLTRYVDPYIGTGGHGHVFLGAHVPLERFRQDLPIIIKVGTGAQAIIIRTAL